MQNFEPNEKQLQLLGELAVTMQIFFNENPKMNQIRNGLNEAGTPLLAMALDIMLEVKKPKEQVEKRVFFVDREGGVTFTDEIDAEFRRLFNITLKPPGEK